MNLFKTLKEFKQKKRQERLRYLADKQWIEPLTEKELDDAFEIMKN